LSITGTNADDTLLGTSGNDTINGGNGNDTIFGGGGNDSISGGNGNDIIDGGSGSDFLFGNNGDDTAIYVAIDNLAANDVYEGGLGSDTLILKLTQSQLNEMNASTVFADFHAAVGSSTAFNFSAYGFSFNINLTAKGFERIETVLIADPAPPAAHADTNAITEDAIASTVIGNVLANDTMGGIADASLSVTNASVLNGRYGTLTLNPDGSYSYLLDQANAAVDALNDGGMLQESFAYTITDGYSHGTSQLTVTINGHTDPAPPVARADANAIAEDGTSSTIAGNVLANDTLGSIVDAVLSVTNAGVVSGLYGALTLNADGSYGYVLDQSSAALDALNDGGALQETFAYTITDGYRQATSQLTVTINGHTDPSLFTAGDEAVDFNAVIASGYRAGTQYDALGGNDTIILPGNAAEAAEAGFVVGTTFHTGDGQNTVFGGGLNDIVIGGSGSDTIDGGAGNDTLSGGGGNDVLTGGLGDDFIDGGDGTDAYVLTTAGFVNLASGISINFGGGFDHLTSIEQVYGSAFNDVIVGNDGENTFAGGAGDDRIDAGGGDDIVIAGTGHDILDGGDGINRVDYSSLANGVTVFLQAGAGFAQKSFFPQDITSDTLSNFRDVTGSNFDDSITGDAQDNSLLGGGGDDFLVGGAGNDHLDGGIGSDLLFGGDGDDELFSDSFDNRMDGGAGNDTANYSGVDVGLEISLYQHVAGVPSIVNSYPSPDLLPAALYDIENIVGSKGNDLIVGDNGDNRLEGFLGDDTMIGGGGRDVFHFDLSGGANVGNDTIVEFVIGVDHIGLGGGLHVDLSDLNPQQIGEDTVLDLGPVMKLTLQHVIASQLTNNDFIF